ILSKVIRQVYLCQECDSELEVLSLAYERILVESFQLTVENEDIKADIESISNYIMKMFTAENRSENVDSNIFTHQDMQIYLNTIHGVKGETHLSTLLLESTIRV